MFVIEVIPLRRGSHIESLSYYSGTSYKPGSIITIPVRNQELSGIVVGSKEVSTTKTALKAATFSLKKLPHQTNIQTLSPALITTANKLSEYYACQSGAVLYELLSPEIRSGKISLPHTHHVLPETKHTPDVLVGTTDERFLSYRSLVRETFAHSGSVLFIVPGTAEIDAAKKRLESGIEDRVIELHNGLTAKKMREAYEKLEDFSKSKLIISTPSYSIIERHDITLTVLEHERSGHYRTRTRPYLDYRDVHEQYSKETGRQLVYGDLVVRNEIEYLRREEVYGSIGETPKRTALPGKLSLLNLKDKPMLDEPFKLFSPKVIEAIQETHSARGKSFLFCARRGLAPVVACIDCGYIFRSPDSGAPYSLIRTKKNGEEKRWFVCSASGQRMRALDICPDCGSWRLRERGIGIQHVYDELSKILNGIPIILFDHTTAGTPKKVQFLIEKFYKTKGAILLGTHMAIPHIKHPVDTSVVVSVDALRATPTWRQQEENLALLLALREHTTGTVFVQTRTGSDETIDYAKTGALERFHTEEIELRKIFHYPPFSVFIHLTWQGNKHVVGTTEKDVKKILEGVDVSYYGAPPSPKDIYIRYGLIRQASTDWPAKKLIEKIRSLPPSVRVVINPDRIV